MHTSAETLGLSELPAFFRRIAQQDREFVIFDDGWRGWTYSYADIASMAEALAARFCSMGIAKGDRIIVWSESRPGWIAALWGCIVSGAVLVPVEPRASSNLFERIARKVQPRLVLLGDSVAGLKRLVLQSGASEKSKASARKPLSNLVSSVRKT